MLNINPIELKGEFVAFQFKEFVNAAGMFNEIGSGVIAIANNVSHQKSANDPRWVTVLKTGPNVKDPAIVPGAQVLVAPLRWSLGVPVEGTEERFNVTKESELLAVWEE